MMKEYLLTPDNGRKSFYGKARVIEKDGEKLLKSYDTIVCKIDKNGNFVRCWNDYSRTTAAHVDSFRRLFDLPGISKKAWQALEVKKA